MTLTTHIIIAAAVAKPLLNVHPAFAFLAALASHYLSDAIPHWDYKPFPEKSDEWEAGVGQIKLNDPAYLRGFLRITVDFFIGSLLLFLILRPDGSQEFLSMAAAILGGVLPDFLQGLYGTRYFEFLRPIQRFHDKIHSKIKLGPYPLIGAPFQIIIFLTALYWLA